jgi:hypothetical protein
MRLWRRGRFLWRNCRDDSDRDGFEQAEDVE